MSNGGTLRFQRRIKWVRLPHASITGTPILVKDTANGFGDPYVSFMACGSQQGMV